MWLYDWFKNRLARSLGIKVRAASDPSQDVSTTKARIVATTDSGVDQLKIDLAGNWTTAALTARLGLDWRLPITFITITNPSITYTATGNVSLVATMLGTIPKAKIFDQLVYFRILPGPQISIQVCCFASC